MKIRWLEDSIRDLTALRQYIAQENPIAARRVAKRIIQSVNLQNLSSVAARPQGRDHQLFKWDSPEDSRVSRSACVLLHVLVDYAPFESNY